MTRILLVDDDEAITSTLGPLLERSGFSVQLARDGVEALRVIREARPDLVILDVRMPRLDGREACRRLREARDWTPVIMLTELCGARTGWSSSAPWTFVCASCAAPWTTKQPRRA